MKYLNKIIFFLLIVNTFAYSQSFLDHEISVVEYNTDWNKSNHFNDLDNLKNCKTFTISLCENPNYMERFEIKQPTIVIYNNGNELKRFTSNIMLTFEIKIKHLQKEVDQILFNKFN